MAKQKIGIGKAITRTAALPPIPTWVVLAGIGIGLFLVVRK